MNRPTTIFITGSGRSGTNVTKAIFGNHSKCAALPFEYRMSIDPGGIVDFINQYASTWSPFMADVRLRALEDFLSSLAHRDDDAFSGPTPYAGWELEQWMPGYQKLVKNLMNELCEYDYEGMWPGASTVPGSRMKFGRPMTKSQLIAHCSDFLYGCINEYAICQRSS